MLNSLSTKCLQRKLKRVQESIYSKTIVIVLCIVLCGISLNTAFAQDSEPSNTVYLPQIMVGQSETEPTSIPVSTPVSTSVPISTSTARPTFIANRAPTLTQPINRFNIIGNQINVWLRAEDPDGDSLSYRAENLPSGVEIDNQTGQISGTTTGEGAYIVTVYVDDGDGGTDNASFTWFVESNSAPNQEISIAPISDQKSAQGESIFLTFSVIGGSPNGLSFSAVGLPPGLAIGKNTGQIEGATTQIGSYEVVITVEDITGSSNGSSSSISFKWDVVEKTPDLDTINRLPNIEALNNRENSLGETVFLSVGANDPDGDRLTFSATGLPPGMLINAESGIIAGELQEVGQYNIVVTVTDSNGGEKSASFQWTVMPPAEPSNASPTVNAIADRIDSVGAPIFLAIGAEDADGDAVTFSATGLPTGVEIKASSGIISGQLNTVGDYTVTIIVDDGNGGRVMTQFMWVVDDDEPEPTATSEPDENTPSPTATSMSGESTPEPTAMSTAGGSTPESTTTSTPNRSTPGPTATSTPSESTPAPTATSMPTKSTPEPTAMSTPNESTPEPTATPTPGENSSPRLTNIGLQSSLPDSLINLQIEASDADNDTLTFSAISLPDGLTINSSNGLISGTFVATRDYVVTITVDDGRGGTDRGSFLWIAAGVSQNNSPRIFSPGNLSSEAGDTIALQIEANDIDGDSLTFGASGLPNDLAIDAESGLISGTIAEAGSFAVTLTIDDGSSTAIATFAWSVAEPIPNNPPVVQTIEAQTNVAGDTATLQLIANDPDGDPLIYSATGLPLGIKINSENGAITGIIKEAGTYEVTLMANDEQEDNNIGSTSFVWTVDQLPIKNVSRRKLATQSSTLWNGVATRAVDGNTSGNFDIESTTHTGPERYAWWEVDLGTAYELTSIRIWNRTDGCCDDRLKDFYVLTSDAPFISDQLNIVLNQEDVRSYHYSELAGTQTEIELASAGRYVRIQLAGTNFLSMAEVEVFGRRIVGNLEVEARSTFEIVPLSTNTDAVEKSSRQSKFRIRRSAALDTVELQLAMLGSSEQNRASATPDDYTLSDDAENTLTTAISFPAGIFERTITVKANVDNVPEVPEALQIQLQASPDYELKVDGDSQTLMLRDAEPGVTGDSKILLAQMTSEGGAITSASGIATVRLSNDNSYGLVSSNFTGLTSPQTAAHIHVNNPGATSGPVVFSLPIGQVTDRRWDLEAAHHLDTDQAVLDALLAGGLYLNTHTVNYPNGEIRNTLLATQASPEMQIPPDPEPIETLTGFELKQDIARFLTQATFGPTLESVSELEVLVTQNGGDQIAAYEQWLDTQISLKSPSLLEYYKANRKHYFALDPTVQNQFFRLGYGITEGWFASSMYSKNQLRERVGFALSEIFVISIEDNQILGEPLAATSYYDMLRENAFGSYENLLTDVSLHPAMGWYLSHLRNQAETLDAEGEAITSPDENYAREIMQLFSIGLIELHPDGSLRLTQQGTPIRTYDQSTITELARVFTGWGLAVRDTDSGNAGTTVENTNFNFNGHSRTTAEYHPYATQSMKMFEDNGVDVTNPNYIRYHDNGEKSILGQILPASQTGEQDLAQMMNILSKHPNTAPFISYRLIQRLVTSNPSAGYIYRVATRFEETDGDLGEVIKAVLLDPEARDLSRLDQIGHGKKKEPLVHLTSVMRLIDAKTDTAATFNLSALQQYGLPTSEVALYESQAAPVSLDYSRFGRGGSGFLQGPLQAPSVFNWYLPNYAPPGTIPAAGLVAPELQHATENTAILYYNVFYRFFMTAGFYGNEPQYTLANARTTFDQPQWLIDAYTNVLDSNADGSITPDDAGFADPLQVRAASTAMVDILDLYICAGRLQAEATGNPETDAREIIINGIVETLDDRDHSTAGNALTARTERIKEALYLISSAPQCTMQR